MTLVGERDHVAEVLQRHRGRRSGIAGLWSTSGPSNRSGALPRTPPGAWGSPTSILRLAPIRSRIEQITWALFTRGLGLFVRSPVGLDRGSAKQAFAAVVAGRTIASNQPEFIDMIVDHLTRSGIVPVERLRASPCTDLHSGGPDGLFDDPAIGQIAAILADITDRAAA